MRMTMTVVAALAIASCGVDGDRMLTPDAHAVVPCPGESLYTQRPDVPSCSVRDVRATSSTLPAIVQGTFPRDVAPSPLGSDFVVIDRVFADPFNGNVLGTFYTLDGGCGEGGALHNGCEFAICVDVF